MNDFLQQKLTDIANNPFHQFIGIHNLYSTDGEGSLQKSFKQGLDLLTGKRPFRNIG